MYEEMDNPHCQSGPSNSRSPYHSPRSGQAPGGGKAPGNTFASSSMSGMSNRTSPLGNKTVAFSKPGDGPSATSFTRMGPEAMHRGGPRLRAEGLMVPPASDAATLRRQVAALQIDLEAHIDGEQRLQNINQQLRERLEVYMKQNHENVERAETELNTLHEDMEQTLELQRRLAQRATALEKEKKELETVLKKRVQEFENERTCLQNRIQSMGEDLRAKAEAQEKVDQLQKNWAAPKNVAFEAVQAELSSTLDVKAKLEERLVTSAKETACLKKRADDYSKELRDLILKEQFNQMLDKMGRKTVVRRAFINFQLGVREQRIDKENTVHARKLYRHHCCKKILFNLRIATQRSSGVRRVLDLRCKKALHACWRFWKLIIIAKRMGVNARKRQDMARLFHSMHVWVAYIVRLRLSPERYLIAVTHWDRKCLQIYFGRWLFTLRHWRLGVKEEKLLTGKAMRHFRKSLLHSCYKSWKDWLKTYAIPKKRKFAEVQAHINMMTMKQATAAWRCIVYVKWVRRMKFEQATELSRALCIKRTFSRWQQGLRTVKIDKIRSFEAIAFRATKTGRFVIVCWRSFLQYRVHMRVYKKMAFRHYLHKLSVKSMHIWRENVNYEKAQQRATAEVNQALTRAAMVFWRDFHVYESIKKKKDHRAAIHVKRKYIKLAKKILGLWWEQAAWKRKAMQLDSMLAARRRRTLLIQSLHIWLHATFDGLLIANARFHEELLGAQAQLEEQKHQVTTVDVENLQLVDRLHTLSSEVAYLKTTISEKEKLEEDLHRALEDGAVLESSMRSEIEQLHCRSEELECELQCLQKKIQMKNSEDAAGEIRYTLEIRNLEQSLKELHIQLADKTSQVDSYEKALRETAERLEGASDESQEKLTSAFEIAGSLRKLLEDRESQFATLEGNCRRRELELGEMQRKLAVANCTLCETVECRDFRIQELETLLCAKQQEVQEVQQQLQNMELAMDAKESRVRKLEYEIKLISEQTPMKTKPFASSSNPWSATPHHHDPRLRCYSTQQCMHHTYEEADNACQQHRASTISEGAPTLVRGDQRYAHETEAPSTAYDEIQQERIPCHSDALPESLPGIADDFESLPSHADSRHPVENPPHHAFMDVSSRQLDDLSDSDTDTEMHRQASEERLDRKSRSVLLYGGQHTSQSDWEMSHGPASSARSRPPGYSEEPGSYDLTDQQEKLRPVEAGGGVPEPTGEGPYRMVSDDDPNAVENLQLKIQSLQTSIYNRLGDFPAAEDPPNRSGSRATPRPPPEAGPWYGRT